MTRRTGYVVGLVVVSLLILGAAAETVGRLAGEGSIAGALAGFLKRFFATNF